MGSVEQNATERTSLLHENPTMNNEFEEDSSNVPSVTRDSQYETCTVTTEDSSLLTSLGDSNKPSNTGRILTIPLGLGNSPQKISSYFSELVNDFFSIKDGMNISEVDTNCPTSTYLPNCDEISDASSDISATVLLSTGKYRDYHYLRNGHFRRITDDVESINEICDSTNAVNMEETLVYRAELHECDQSQKNMGCASWSCCYVDIDTEDCPAPTVTKVEYIDIPQKPQPEPERSPPAQPKVENVEVSHAERKVEPPLPVTVAREVAPVTQIPEELLNVDKPSKLIIQIDSLEVPAKAGKPTLVFCFVTVDDQILYECYDFTTIRTGLVLLKTGENQKTWVASVKKQIVIPINDRMSTVHVHLVRTEQIWKPSTLPNSIWTYVDLGCSTVDIKPLRNKAACKSWENYNLRDSISNEKVPGFCRIQVFSMLPNSGPPLPADTSGVAAFVPNGEDPTLRPHWRCDPKNPRRLKAYTDPSSILNQSQTPRSNSKPESGDITLRLRESTKGKTSGDSTESKVEPTDPSNISTVIIPTKDGATIRTTINQSSQKIKSKA